MASDDKKKNSELDTLLNYLRSSIYSWEDMVVKSQKLNSSLKITCQSINTIIESLESVFKSTIDSNFSGVEKIENSLTDLGIIEKYLSDKLLFLNNAIQKNLVIDLVNHIENWNRSIINIRKRRELDKRKAKTDFKKSIAVLGKLESKISRRSGKKRFINDTVSIQIDNATRNVSNSKNYIEELERHSLAKAICENRNRYKQFLECLRPVLDAQLSIKSELEQIQSIYDQLYTFNTEDLTMLTPDIEEYVRQFQIPADLSRFNSAISLHSRVNSNMSLVNGNDLFSKKSFSSKTTSSDNNSGFGQTDFSDELPTMIQIDQLDTYMNGKDFIKDRTGLKTITPAPKTVTARTTTEESFYPNPDVVTPSLLRYSNLRELKQNGDEKYKTVGHLRNQIYGDPAKSKRFSVINDNINSRRTQSYSECFEHQQSKDNNDVVFNYDSESLFTSDDISGTSTFKRRKPITPVPMEVPVLICQKSDKMFDDSTTNATTTMKTMMRSQRSYSADRQGSCYDNQVDNEEKTNLEPSPLLSRVNQIENLCNNHSNYAKGPRYKTRNSYIYPGRDCRIPKVPGNHDDFGRTNIVNNNAQSEQFLIVPDKENLQYQKSLSLVSSQIF